MLVGSALDISPICVGGVDEGTKGNWLLPPDGVCDENCGVEKSIKAMGLSVGIWGRFMLDCDGPGPIFIAGVCDDGCEGGRGEGGICAV